MKKHAGKPFRLNRRTVLRGAGSVALALPWLEAMEPVRDSVAASAADPARRFLAVYQPGGTVLERWTPSGTESSFQLSPILSPFAPVQDRILVLSGLDMNSAQAGTTDAAGMVAWLTGTAQRESGDASDGYALGPSLDQVLAERLSQVSRRRWQNRHGRPLGHRALSGTSLTARHRELRGHQVFPLFNVLARRAAARPGQDLESALRF